MHNQGNRNGIIKPIPILFLILQILDIISTLIGVNIGLLELNPLSDKWHNMLTAKMAVTIGVASILQIKKTSRLDWILIIICASVVLWNVGMIILHLLTN